MTFNSSMKRNVLSIMSSVQHWRPVSITSEQYKKLPAVLGFYGFGTVYKSDLYVKCKCCTRMLILPKASDYCLSCYEKTNQTIEKKKNVNFPITFSRSFIFL